VSGNTAETIRHTDWSGSLNDLLAAQGHRLVSSTARIRAVDLPAAVSQRYRLEGIAPWLLIAETAIATSRAHARAGGASQWSIVDVICSVLIIRMAYRNIE
jgi:hypothetical protein